MFLCDSNFGIGFTSILFVVGFTSISSAQNNENGTLSFSQDVSNSLKQLLKLTTSQHEQVQSQLASLNQTVQEISLKLDKISQIHKSVVRKSRKIYYDFNVSYIDGAPDGVGARKILATNGQFPGPMIIGNLGDEVTIRVTNNIEGQSEPITIHWHGLFQNGSQFEDGAEGVTQCGIPPGKTQTYTFKLEQTGTFWWHSHVVHQYTEGLFGPLIILNPAQNDPSDSDPYIRRYDPEDEIVLLLSDWNHKSGAEIAKWYLSPDSDGNEPIPDSILVNGRGSYPCDQVQAQPPKNHSSVMTCDLDLQTAWRFWVTQGKTYRIRVINAAGFTSFNFSIDGHKLEVIETDGNLVQSKSTPKTGPLVDIFSLSPGKRFSVLVTMNNSLIKVGEQQKFAIRSAALTNQFPDEGPDIRSNPGVLHPETHAILQYESSDVMQRNLRRKFQFQYFQNFDDTFTTKSPKNPTVSKTPSDTPSVTSTDNNSPVFLDEHSLYSIHEPAPSSCPSKILEIPLTIEKMEDDHHRNQGFYLTFNNISYSYKITNNNNSNNEINTPLLTRVLNQQPLPPNAHPIYLPQLGQIVQLIVNNHDDGGHPLHLHGHKFWVLGTGKENDGDYIKADQADVNSPFALDFDGAPRDTAWVEGKSWLVLRFISDNPGVWLFHCHMQWHSMGGLKLAFIEAEEELRRRVKQIPEETKRICSYNGIEL